MAFQKFERSITEDEKDSLLAPFKPPRGFMSKFAYYGLFIILVPFSLGGLIGTILKLLFNVYEDTAYSFGFLTACLASIIAFLHSQKVRRRDAEAYERTRQEILKKGVIEVYDFFASEAWDLGEELGYWPAYIFWLESNDFIYVDTEKTAFSEEDDFPREHIIVEVLPVSHSIVSVHANGKPLSATPLLVKDEELQLYDFFEFQIFKKDSIPVSLLAKIRK
jgi:hypothetical protein